MTIKRISLINPSESLINPRHVFEKASSAPARSFYERNSLTSKNDRKRAKNLKDLFKNTKKRGGAQQASARRRTRKQKNEGKTLGRKANLSEDNNDGAAAQPSSPGETNNTFAEAQKQMAAFKELQQAQMNRLFKGEGKGARRGGAGSGTDEGSSLPVDPGNVIEANFEDGTAPLVTGEFPVAQAPPPANVGQPRGRITTSRFWNDLYKAQVKEALDIKAKKIKEKGAAEEKGGTKKRKKRKKLKTKTTHHKKFKKSKKGKKIKQKLYNPLYFEPEILLTA